MQICLGGWPLPLRKGGSSSSSTATLASQVSTSTVGNLSACRFVAACSVSLCVCIDGINLFKQGIRREVQFPSFSIQIVAQACFDMLWWGCRRAFAGSPGVWGGCRGYREAACRGCSGRSPSSPERHLRATGHTSPHTLAGNNTLEHCVPSLTTFPQGT